MVDFYLILCAYSVHSISTATKKELFKENEGDHIQILFLIL